MSHPGLRERKKIKTRATIRREALRLFLRQGYDETTVEQIAEAAEVSPSTFFRYFATKEHVVLGDDYEQLVLAAIDARPEDEPPLLALRNGIVDLCRSRFGEDRDELLMRMQLIDRVPALRLMLPQQRCEESGFLVSPLAKRMRRDPEDLEVRVLGQIVGIAVAESLLAWARDDGRRSLEELFVDVFRCVSEAFASI